MAKSTLEKQLQQYGEYQRSINKMSHFEKLKYSAPGTKENLEYQLYLEKADKREVERKKQLEKYDKENKPAFGHLGALSAEQAQEIAELVKQFNADRKKFIDKMNKEIPSLYV